MQITLKIEDASPDFVKRLVENFRVPDSANLGGYLPKDDDPCWSNADRLDDYFCQGLLSQSAAGWADFYRLKEMYIKLKNVATQVVSYIHSATTPEKKQGWEEKHDTVLKSLSEVKKKLAEIVAYFNRERQNLRTLRQEREKRIKRGADRDSPEIKRIDAKIADAKEQLAPPKHKPTMPKLVHAS